jgi:hypothetical protein
LVSPPASSLSSLTGLPRSMRMTRYHLKDTFITEEMFGKPTSNLIHNYLHHLDIF